MSEVMDRRADQSVLLATIDRRDAVPEITAAAHPNFDEYKFTAVIHHKIDFAAPCPIISCNKTKTAADEESLGCTFGMPTEFRRTCF
jgi:hypothetical protein